MLEDRERHDEKLPLFVLVAAGSTAESRDGLRLLDIYDADAIVVDAGYPDDEMAGSTDVFVNPYPGDGDSADVTTTVLASNVAAHVNPDVRDDVSHLPAVSYWTDPPGDYVELAAVAGYDEAHTTALREAVALEAHYHSYEDKRELITDLLFEHGKRDLAEHVSGQFREKLDRELDTVEPNLDRRDENGVRFTVLDAAAFAHRFDFPPTDLLVDALHRRGVGDDDADGPRVTLAAGEDEIRIRSDGAVDARTVADAVRDRVPDAGVSARGTRDGTIEFVAGEREAVLDAAIAVVGDRLGG